MIEERIKEVFSDEEFVKELFSKETPEEAQELLADKGIELSIDEICKVREMLINKLSSMQSGEELTDDDLEGVSGGVLALAMTIFGLVVVGVGTVIAIVDELVQSRW